MSGQDSKGSGSQEQLLRGVGPSFTSPQRVRFDSLRDSQDLGAWESLKADLSGEIGAATGTQSLFFKFRMLAPGSIRLRLEPVSPWTDRFLQVSLLDQERRSLALDVNGYASPAIASTASSGGTPALLAAGEYRVVLTCSQWQRTQFRISLGISPRETLTAALSGRGSLSASKLNVAVIKLQAAMRGQGRLASGGSLWSGRRDRPLGRGPMSGSGRLRGTLSTRIASNPLGAGYLSGRASLGGSRVTTSSGGARFWVSRLTAATELGYDTRAQVCLYASGDSLTSFLWTPAGGVAQYFAFVRRNLKGEVLWTRVTQQARTSAAPEVFSVFPLPDDGTLLLGTHSVFNSVSGFWERNVLHVAKLSKSGELVYYRAYRASASGFFISTIGHLAYHSSSNRIVMHGSMETRYSSGGSFVTEGLPYAGLINPDNGDLTFRTLSGWPEEKVNGYSSCGICIQPNGRIYLIGFHDGTIDYNYVVDISSDLTQVIRAFQYTDASSFRVAGASSVLDASGTIHVFSGGGSTNGIIQLDSGLNLSAYYQLPASGVDFSLGNAKDVQLSADGTIHIVARDLTTVGLDGETTYRQTTYGVTGQPSDTIRDLDNRLNSPVVDAVLRFRLRQFGRQAFNGLAGHVMTLIGHEVDMPSTSITTAGVTYTAGRASTATILTQNNARLSTVTRNSLSLILAAGSVTAETGVSGFTLLNAAGTLSFTLTQDSVVRGTGGIYPAPQADPAVSVEPDPYRTAVALHMPMSGMPDTAVFTDYSLYGHSITGYGNADLSSAQARFPDLGGNYESVSALLDGTGDYLEGPTHAAFQFRGGDLTVETWIYLISATSAPIFENMPNGGPVARTNAFTWYLNSSRQLLVWANNAVRTTTSLQIPLNTWTHIALTRAQQVWRIFIGGAPDPNAFRLDIDLTAGGCLIGRFCNDTTSPMLNAHLQDYRITNGSARYTRRFTPRSTPIQYTPLTVAPPVSLPAEPAELAGTTPDTEWYALVLFLRCNGTGSSFVDSSESPNTVTAWGNATQVASAGKWGGAAGRLDGDGDYLAILSNSTLALGSGDYTVSLYATRSGNATGPDAPMVLLDARTAEPSSQFCLRINRSSTGRQVVLFVNGVARIVGNPAQANARYHIEVSRVSGVTRLFMNGKQVGNSWADSTNFTATTWTIGRGALQVGDSWWHFLGDINDVRILTGLGLHAADFTPPSRAYGGPPNNAYRYIRFSGFDATSLNVNTLDMTEIRFYDVNDNLITGVTATSSFSWTAGAASQLTDGVLTSAGRLYRDSWSSFRATATIDFDLGTAKVIKSVRIYSTFPSTVRFPATFKISGSSSNGAGYGPQYTVRVGSTTTWTTSSTDVGDSGLKAVYLF